MTKDRMFTIRCTGHQLKAWRRLAKMGQRKLPDWIRLVLDDVVHTLDNGGAP